MVERGMTEGTENKYANKLTNEYAILSEIVK